jgi:hypothetical protein
LQKIRIVPHNKHFLKPDFFFEGKSQGFRLRSGISSPIRQTLSFSPIELEGTVPSPLASFPFPFDLPFFSYKKADPLLRLVLFPFSPSAMTSTWSVGVPQGGAPPHPNSPWIGGLPPTQTSSMFGSSGFAGIPVVASENINEGTVMTVTPAPYKDDSDSYKYFSSMVNGFVVVADQFYPGSRVRQSVMTLQRLNQILVEKHATIVREVGEDELDAMRIWYSTSHRASTISMSSTWTQDPPKSYFDDSHCPQEITDIFQDHKKKDAFLHTIPAYVYRRYCILGVKAQVPTGGFQHIQPGGSRSSKDTPDYSFSVGVHGCHRVFPYWSIAGTFPGNVAVGFLLTKAATSGALAIAPWTSEYTCYTVPLTCDRVFQLTGGLLLGRYYPFGVIVEGAVRPSSQGDTAALLDAGFPLRQPGGATRCTDSTMRGLASQDSQLIVNIRMQGQIVHEGF